MGEDHPDALASASNLALNLRRLGEYGEARKLDEAVLARRRLVLGVNPCRYLPGTGHDPEAPTHPRLINGRDH